MRDALGRVRRVLVLGGTSEIGLAIATRLVDERGAGSVVLAGRDQARLARAADTFIDRGVEVETVGFDATDDGDDHARLLEDVFANGDVDVTVIAFGVLGDQTAAEGDPARAVHIARINYLGAVSVGVPLANRLQRQGHGAVVALSSVAGDRARRANFIYGSSKAGLDTFYQGLGDRLRRFGVQVLVVRPGFVHTRMTVGREPAPFATDPAGVADAVLRGLDRGAHTVYAPPILRVVMWVLRHLPRPLFRLLPG